MTSIAKKQPRVRAKNHIKESTGRKVFRIVNAVVLTALALICLLPFVNVIAISFSNSFYVDSNQVYFWPKGWTVNAYTYILTRASFWTSFRTSILRVLLGGGLNLFGDINIADEDSSKGSVHSFAVDPELILERNPDMILYNVYSTSANAGTSIYLKLDESEIPAVLADVCQRPGWDQLTAVQNRQVYGFTAFAGNACFKIVASCYIAKWLYPDVFAELDPDAFFNEWLTVYQNAEPLGAGQVGQLQ